MNKLIAFTDGSCNYKTRQGGYGVYFTDTNFKEVGTARGGFEDTTISRMEMIALLESINRAVTVKCTHLTVYTDSEFVYNSFIKGWLDKWIDKDFAGVKNSDIWRKILSSFMKLKDFEIYHTRGHRKDLEDPIAYGNSRADELANYKTQER